MRYAKGLALSVLLGVGQLCAAILPVGVRFQEKLNWDWAAIEQMVLSYYGQYPSQTAIAAVATPGMSNSGVLLYGTSYSRLGVNELLATYGISSTYYNRALTATELDGALNAGQLVIASKYSGLELVNGYVAGFVLSVSPWPGMGPTMSSYNDFLSVGDYPWDQTLVVTSPRGAVSSRVVPESSIPRDFALYAFDNLKVNDGVKCYQDAWTVTNYCKSGSSYAYGLFTSSDTYGLILGASAKVGEVQSSGPVWMRSNSWVQGNVLMNTPSSLEQQSPVTIGGALIQSTVPYRGFGWGNVDFTGVAQTSTMIEPDQAPRTLAPGRYWDMTIKARSPVRLRAGDYSFRKLICDVCTIEIDASAGPVRIYVDNAMTWTGSLTYVSGGPSRLMLSYLGSSALYLNGSLNGTVVAPNAELILAQTHKNYNGMYLARRLTVHQYATIRFEPFAFE